MNKLELIAALREETGIQKPEAQAIVDMFFNSMPLPKVIGWKYAGCSAST